MVKQELFNNKTKEKRGLYDPAYEHDACGVGMIVNIHGNKSHELVESALKVLENMRHRGAEGADNKTGDGAGIMLQIPHEFILLQGIPVPEKGRYGTGILFLPKDKKDQEAILSIIIEEIEKDGLTLMHLRNVPTCPEILGEAALYYRIHRQPDSRKKTIYYKEKNRKPHKKVGHSYPKRLLRMFAIDPEHCLQRHVIVYAIKRVLS